MSSHDTATPPRTTVRIPTASGDEIEAWVYRPEGDGPHPAIVMAHGFAGVKAGGLEPFAERFCREGFTAVAFDYGQWGSSSGRPRDETSVPRQREDYRNVIDWAAADPDTVPAHIVIRGTSFSGMHVGEIAATDARLRGAIAQCPLVDGLVAMTMVPPKQLLRPLELGLQDRLGSPLGRPPRHVTASAAPGEFGVIAAKDALAGVELIRPKNDTEWHNRAAARSLLDLAAHRPVRDAAEIRCPILVGVPENDTIAQIGPALRVAERAPKGELFRSRGGHYGPYDGGTDHDRVINAEVEFVHRHAHASRVRSRPVSSLPAAPQPISARKDRNMSQIDLQHQVVAITGGARGIGLATATALASCGARVAIGDLDADAAQTAAQQIGAGAIGLSLDVTQRSSFEAFLDRVEDALGTLEVLVNNAGIQHVGLFADESDASTAAQVAVNLGGVMTGTKLALARMRPRGHGHIVNLASVAGKVASPGGSTYAATKHAVVGLSESLRGELRDSGIAVTVVMPAIIATEMSDGLASARGLRPIQPQAVGEAIARAIAGGRGIDVYVPGYLGAINAAMTIAPRRVQQVIRHAMRADEVLLNVDRAARAGYDLRVRPTHADDPAATRRSEVGPE